MTDEPRLPSPRDAAADRLRVVIERLNDRRIREHSEIRRIHKRTGSQQCQVCRTEWPCPTMKAIGQESAV